MALVYGELNFDNFMEQPGRSGVVGLGRFGRFHARTFRALNEAHLVGFVDVCCETLSAHEFPDVPAWTNLEHAIRECNADAWVVAASTTSHAAAGELILSAGKSALIEKPIAEDIDSA